MKIRNGFVTNSSSTNFLIISKEELNEEFLFEKLGFRKNGIMSTLGCYLVEEILQGVSDGPRYLEIEKIDFKCIEENFGKADAKRYAQMNEKGCFAYMGYTASDDSCLASFMAMDNFVIDEKDFYMNGLNCVW